MLAQLSPRRRAPTGSQKATHTQKKKNAPPMRRDFHKLWPIKSQLYLRNNTFSRNHSPNFCDAGKKSEKYHLLLMSLRTFGASLGSTALHHCITTRWVLAEQLKEFYWKQGLAFELLNPARKSAILSRWLSAPSAWRRQTRWIKF